jgi:hypothetical protein
VGTPADPTPSGEGLIVDFNQLATLPMSGSAWTSLLAVANASLGTVDFVEDAQNTTPGKVFAAALAYKRTGTQSYKDKVVAVLDTIATSTIVGSRVLNTGRQLAGYCASANLVGYTNTAFMNFMDTMRTYDIGGHASWHIIAETSEITSNNWGGWALASRTAMSAIIGDATDVSACAVLYNAYFDRSVYSGWGRTADYDPTWSHNSAAFIPVNPDGYPGKSGAPVEDISRSAGAYPSYDDTGIMYAWEILGGLVLTARVLEHNGYPTVWTWGNNGPLRIAQFLKSLTGGWPAPYGNTQYISWEVKNHYGASGDALGTPPAAGYGRQFGFTDWLTV